MLSPTSMQYLITLLMRRWFSRRLLDRGDDLPVHGQVRARVGGVSARARRPPHVQQLRATLVFQRLAPQPGD